MSTITENSNNDDSTDKAVLNLEDIGKFAVLKSAEIARIFTRIVEGDSVIIYGKVLDTGRIIEWNEDGKSISANDEDTIEIVVSK